MKRQTKMVLTITAEAPRGQYKTQVLTALREKLNHIRFPFGKVVEVQPHSPRPVYQDKDQETWIFTLTLEALE